MDKERNNFQDQRLDRLEKKVDSIVENHLPHLKGEVSILGGKFDNFSEFVTRELGEVKEVIKGHWPKALAIAIAVLTSALVGLLTLYLSSLDK